MLLGNEHAKEAVLTNELPNVVWDVAQLVPNAPIVELLTKLLSGPVEKGLLLVGECDRSYCGAVSRSPGDR